MVPSDPLNKVSKIINSLLIDCIDYIAFVAQRHRVVLSLGETKILPDEFIIEWCAALEAIELLKPENPFVIVPEHDKIVITSFFPCLKVILFFTNKATKDRVNLFLDRANRSKQDLIGLFKSKDLKPKMPQMPKHEVGGRRKLNQNPK